MMRAWSQSGIDSPDIPTLWCLKGQHITRKGTYDELRCIKSKDGERLMPTTPTRAGMMIKCGDATPYWDHGVFCIRLNREPSKRFKQEIVVGVDPGSKKEGFT